jgi:hypothetical protein
LENHLLKGVVFFFAVPFLQALVFFAVLLTFFCWNANERNNDVDIAV